MRGRPPNSHDIIVVFVAIALVTASMSIGTITFGGRDVNLTTGVVEASSHEWQYNNNKWDVSGQTASPESVHELPNGNFLVSDSGKVYEYNSSMGHIATHDISGQVSFASDAMWNGTHYLVPTQNAEVVIYDDTWTHVGSKSVSDYTSTPMELTYGPSDGYVYLLDNDNMTIDQYTHDFTHTGTRWNVSSETTEPVGLGYSGDNWYVASQDSGDGVGGDEIFVYDSNGNYTGTNYSIGTNVPNPRSMDLTDAGYWRIADANNANVVQYTADSASPVSGTVTNTSGSALSGANVTTNTSKSNTTASDGSYSFSLSDGTYEITASESGYLNNSTTVTVSGSAVSGVDLTLEPQLTGYVKDDSGNPVENFTVESETGASTTTDANGFYSLPLADGTYNVTAGGDGYTNTTDSVTVAGATGHNFTTAQRAVDGRVEKCPVENPDCPNAPGVADGTVVEVYGVHEKNIDTEKGQTLKERAAEIREDMKSFDAEKLGWDPDRQLTGSKGYFQNVNERYVAVNRPADWGLRGWTDAPELGQPILQTEAGQDIILHVRDPTRNPVVQDGVDSDLPGAVDDDRDIIIEQLDYNGDVVSDPRRVETESTYDVSGLGGSHDYARVTLPKGFYRVHAAGSDVSYVIAVGSPDELTRMITDDLQDKAGNLSAQAQEILDLKNQNKVYTASTTTETRNGEQGHFTITNIPEDVRVVSIQAYSPTTQQLNDPQNATVQDLREVAASENYNGSFVITTHPQDAPVPANNVEVTAVEVDAAPFMDMSRFENKSAYLKDLLSSTGFGDAVPTTLETNDTQKQEIKNQLETVKDQNADLQRKYNELLENESGDATTDEQVQALEQAIRDLKGSLEAQSEDTTTTYQNGTVSSTIPWSDELDPDAVAVTAHFPNQGTSKPVPSEYVTVEKRPGQGDVVEVNEYPVPDGTKMVSFGVTVSGEDGEKLGNTRTDVRNPNFNGAFMDIQSVEVSTIRPGPSEDVTLSVSESDSSAQIQNVNATVAGPNGAVNATVDGNNNVQFRTNGQGVHAVTLEMTDTSGVQWTEKVTLKANKESINQPPSVRVRDGFTGEFVLVSDGLEQGSATTEGGGVTMTAVSPSDNVPRNVHFYTSEISNAYTQTEVNIMKDTSTGAESIQRHVQIYVHTADLNEDAVLYRNGDEPLAVGESTGHGTVNCEDSENGCTIKSYTDARGRAEFTINNNPTVVDRAFHYARLKSPVDIPYLMMAPDVDAITPDAGPFHFQSVAGMDVPDTPGMASPAAAMGGGVPA